MTKTRSSKRFANKRLVRLGNQENHLHFSVHQNASTQMDFNIIQTPFGQKGTRITWINSRIYRIKLNGFFWKLESLPPLVWKICGVKWLAPEAVHQIKPLQTNPSVLNPLVSKMRIPPWFPKVLAWRFVGGFFVDMVVSFVRTHSTIWTTKNQTDVRPKAKKLLKNKNQ